MIVKPGSTDVTTYFHLRLAADGTDATGLTITNFDLQYVRSGVAPVAKVDATALAATDSAHGDNQAIEIDVTDQPGVYRVDWPDAAFAAGVREVILTVKVATVFTESLRVQLQQVPADVTHWLGTAAATPTVAGVPEVDVTHIAGVTTDVSTIPASVAAILVDTGTTLQGELDGIQADTEDIQARLPAALTGDGNIKADTLRIGGTLQTANDKASQTSVDDLPTNAELATSQAAADDATLAAIAALNNLSAAQVNAEADTALADYDPPTRAELTTDINSVLARLVALGLSTGTVTTDGGNSATSFETDLAQTADNYWTEAFLLLTSGAMVGQVKRVTAYNGTTKIITVSGGFTATPADGVTFTLINR